MFCTNMKKIGKKNIHTYSAKESAVLTSLSRPSIAG